MYIYFNAIEHLSCVKLIILSFWILPWQMMSLRSSMLIRSFLLKTSTMLCCFLWKGSIKLDPQLNTTLLHTCPLCESFTCFAICSSNECSITSINLVCHILVGHFTEMIVCLFELSAVFFPTCQNGPITSQISPLAWFVKRSAMVDYSNFFYC